MNCGTNWRLWSGRNKVGAHLERRNKIRQKSAAEKDGGQFAEFHFHLSWEYVCAVGATGAPILQNLFKDYFK